MSKACWRGKKELGIKVQGTGINQVKVKNRTLESSLEIRRKQIKGRRRRKIIPVASFLWYIGKIVLGDTNRIGSTKIERKYLGEWWYRKNNGVIYLKY